MGLHQNDQLPTLAILPSTTRTPHVNPFQLLYKKHDYIASYNCFVNIQNSITYEVKYIQTFQHSNMPPVRTDVNECESIALLIPL
jgi:hypothetical protein